MDWLQNLPIRKKLTLVILMTCAAVLAVACALLVAYERHDFRRAIVRDTTVLAEILGKNTRAALAFQDEAAAREILHALQSEDHIIGARLYAGGAPFADYVRAGARVFFSDKPAADGAVFEPGHLAVYRPVRLNGKRLGTIHLQIELAGIHARLALLAAISGVILAVSLLIAYVLSARLQRPISDPILDLVATAQTIAARKDYTARARSHGNNEVGALSDAFNDMLAGIQERERALRSEIAERKLADEQVRAQLARLAQLHQITRATGERQDLKSIFQVVVRSLEDHLPVDFGCICLHDDTAHTLTVTSVGVHSEALAAELALGENATIPIDENGLARCVRGELVYEPNLLGVPHPFPARLADAGLASLVIAPLLMESKVFGVLIAARRRTDGFGDGEREFLKQLAEHVALSAHQARLHGALQQAYDDLRQSQQAILQQERLRALGQMASGIAHDINNAISPVTLYTDFLLETEPNLSARARDGLTTIQRAMADVAQTVSRMREFYREREPQLALLPVDLNRLVPQVVDLTRVRWSDMQLRDGAVIDLKTDFAAALPAVLGIESELREALTNLVFNAVDAMPQGGALTLRTRCDAGDGPARRVCVEVADTGVGMGEETRRRCLEPFFTTKGERGTGLGLAMVYGTVQRHNAEIEIDSEPGRGTTFRLLFPVPTEAPRVELFVATASPFALRLRLLIADDDPVILKTFGDILLADGHEVVPVSGGQEAIDTFVAAKKAGHPFAMVITDLGMPYIDGRKVAQAIKAASPRTPVILLTGWGERMSAEGDIPEHVDEVFAKPPRIRELRLAFQRLFTSGGRATRAKG